MNDGTGERLGMRWIKRLIEYARRASEKGGRGGCGVRAWKRTKLGLEVNVRKASRYSIASMQRVRGGERSDMRLSGQPTLVPSPSERIGRMESDRWDIT